MKRIRLADVDLNLLVVLDTVLAERSVRRAALQLGVTQPAVSQSLRRLRDALGDPLVISTPKGMVPTARAERLVGRLRRGLDELEDAITDNSEFQPATARRTFLVAATDATSYLLMPPLMTLLAREAPGVGVIVRPPQPGLTFDALQSGELHASIGAMIAPPASCRRKQLFRCRHVCLVRRGHPAASQRKLSMEQYLELAHLQIAPFGRPGSQVDDALAKLGHGRRIALELPHFLAAPEVLASTDLITMMPERLALRLVERWPLCIVHPPVEIEPFSMALMWHERCHHDPAHEWLREMVVKAAEMT
jgi:DNA-binding transcriptional LysR family regulator